jgi:putative GTP pyrophosphokinase
LRKYSNFPPLAPRDVLQCRFDSFAQVGIHAGVCGIVADTYPEHTTTNLSKAQIDKFGNRLKSDELLEPDVQQLDQYRRTFAEPYEHVVGLIRSSLGLEPTGRPAKSTTAIREKLHRESIRLSQVQDIAGCRLVVANMEAQDRAVEKLKAQFDDVTVVDRRQKPSHGYRAVHVIVRFGGKPIEVQVRTTLQHLWG